MAEIVVVGAGIAGLAAARELVRRRPEDRITVYEAQNHPGGLLQSERVDGFLCEQAANGFLDNVEGGALDLARALGVPTVAAREEAARRFVWRRGRLREVPTRPPAFFRTDLLGVRAKLRAALEPFVPRGRREDESVAEFFRRRLGREPLEALVEPFVTGVFAGDPTRLSLASAFPRLAEMERKHGSLLVALVAEGRKGRRAPRLHAPRDGLAALCAALVRELGERVVLGRQVTALVPPGDGAARRRLRFADGVTATADVVVLACPAPAAADLLAPEDAELAALLRAIRYVPAVVVHAAVPQAQVGGYVAGFGFLVARGEAPRCLGCLVESSIWPDRAPKGQVLFRLIYGGARDPDALTLPEEELRGAVQADLERAFAIRTVARVLRIVRHPAALPQYELGHGARVAAIEARARRRRVILAGNPYHGVSVNDCVRDAGRVAAAVEEMLR